MVLDVVRIPRPPLPHPGPKPGVKVDARSERWREHRKKVRSEIVDAAFRAIDRLGPDLSVREVAEEAGHRQAQDLPPLHRQIRPVSGDRCAASRHAVGGDLPVHRLGDRLGARGDPAQCEEYVSLIDKHPNVLRVFIQDRSASTSQSTLRTLNEGREITLAMADMFDNELRDWSWTMRRWSWRPTPLSGRLPRPPSGGWDADIDSPRRMPRDKFVEHADHNHDGCHRRHRRAAGHQGGPRQAHSQCGAARLRRELAALIPSVPDIRSEEEQRT